MRSLPSWKHKLTVILISNSIFDLMLKLKYIFKADNESGSDEDVLINNEDDDDHEFPFPEEDRQSSGNL
jgi:hypothetical protein